MLSYNLFSASFEHMGGGAKALGLSEAFTARADDASAVSYNHAGLAKIKQDQLDMMIVNLYGINIISHSFIGYARVINPGTASIGWIHLGSGDDFFIQDISENTVILGYGYDLFPFITLGMGVKFYGAHYDGIRGTGWGVDLSGLSCLNDFLQIGVHVQDINSPFIEWETQTEERLPLNVNAGLACFIYDISIISMDVRNITTYERTYCVGSEFFFFDKILTLRGGFSYQKIWSFSGGCGVKESNLQFQYSFQKHMDLGWSNILGLTIQI